jgi:hypothetical protein
VVYNGSGSSVTPTGLSSGTIYYFAVIEFNGTGTETKYLRNGYLQNSQTTSSTSNLRLASSSETEDTNGNRELSANETEHEQSAFILSNAFHIYPNPTSDKVTINFSLAEDEFSTLIIYSLQGKVLFNKIYSGSFKDILDLRAFQKGIYIIKVNIADHQSFTKQLVVN